MATWKTVRKLQLLPPPPPFPASFAYADTMADTHTHTHTHARARALRCCTSFISTGSRHSLVNIGGRVIGGAWGCPNNVYVDDDHRDIAQRVDGHVLHHHKQLEVTNNDLPQILLCCADYTILVDIEVIFRNRNRLYMRCLFFCFVFLGGINSFFSHTFAWQKIIPVRPELNQLRCDELLSYRI